MLDYMVQVLLFQTLFLAVYDLILKRETFFQWNRAYLLITSILAYIIPAIKIEQITTVVPQEYRIYLPEVILSPQTVIVKEFDWSIILFTSLKWIFWIGVLMSTAFFLIKLFKLIRLIANNEKEITITHQLIYLESSKAFSFFKYIFLGKHLSKNNKEQIIEHELVHVKQKHTIDLLFFELQKIACWFNPFSYLFQKRISELHEFIADAKSIKEIDKTNYFQNLLAQTFGTHKISFINPFFKHSLIKKRIIMLNKNKSKKIVKFKYLLLLPLLIGMLTYSSCEKENNTEIITKNKNEKRLITLYMGLRDKIERKEIKTKKKGYFDLYMGDAPDGKKITYNMLSNEEKMEYDNTVNAFNKKGENFHSFEIFEMKNGKRALLQTMDWKGMKENREATNYSGEDIVPYAAIDKAPIFPGCENATDQKKCFEEKINEYISKNFNPSIAKTLDLEKGKKRVYVQFTIDKNGIVSEARARAPHIDLEDHAQEIIYDLPNMLPGEHSGKKVAVKYTLPISFVID